MRSPILFLILLLPCGLLSFDVSSLRLVQILHRHGDRSPTHTYPTDPYQEDHWPQGFGQLTKKGKVEMYKVGKFIKKRYVETGFLSKEYKQKEIEVRSTDKDRTLMSASLVLAGLYAPKGRQRWNNLIPWQPIPVHTQPLSEDFLLSLHCPAYVRLLDELFLSKRVMDIQEKNKLLIDYVTKRAGLNPTLADLLEVIDPVYCETSNNLTLPHWLLQDGTWEKVLQLYDLKAQLKCAEPAMARIRGGPLLGRMLQNMQDASEKSGENIIRKAFIYSGHDTTINALLSALKMYNKRKVPLAASVFVELHIIDNKPMVKIFYRNNSAVDPYLLDFAGCETPCPLDKLTTLTKDMIPEDPAAACLGTEVSPRRGISGSTIAVTILTVVIVLVILVLVLVHVLRERHKMALYKYSPVNQHM